LVRWLTSGSFSPTSVLITRPLTLSAMWMPCRMSPTLAAMNVFSRPATRSISIVRGCWPRARGCLGRGGVAFDQQCPYAVQAQERRGRQAGETAADDEDRGAFVVHGSPSRKMRDISHESRVKRYIVLLDCQDISQ